MIDELRELHLGVARPAPEARLGAMSYYEGAMRDKTTSDAVER